MNCALRKLKDGRIDLFLGRSSILTVEIRRGFFRRLNEEKLDSEETFSNLVSGSSLLNTTVRDVGGRVWVCGGRVIFCGFDFLNLPGEERWEEDSLDAFDVDSRGAGVTPEEKSDV